MTNKHYEDRDFLVFALLAYGQTSAKNFALAEAGLPIVPLPDPRQIDYPADSDIDTRYQ